jgi:hypothetical protein
MNGKDPGFLRFVVSLHSDARKHLGSRKPPYGDDIRQVIKFQP